ncbi:hypothetical protein TanjilG_31001 [Lupinus angustifolius]|uniref:Nucleotide-diphospho-sugar transferase domain-containing protein n=1 Tax=Lupinus angustifolius TaxID=3871 RepID=A0A1J7HPB4_LUPAN|nr:hypothetical protein TanjilG_31001 [Lupinus angustifolius]
MKESATAGGVENGGSKPLSSGGSGSSRHLLVKRVVKVTAFFVGITVLWMVLYKTASPFGFASISQHFIGVFANDADIMWFRDPFKEFYKDSDFQIACDFFNGNSYDLDNMPNGGLTYVKSNFRTIWFYRYWFASKDAYPKMHDQDVFNKIKKNNLIAGMKLKIRFLSTEYFGGFCQPSKDLNKVSTMHANCCVGLDNKIIDLKILLEDWRKYMAWPDKSKKQLKASWSVPLSCR